MKILKVTNKNLLNNQSQPLVERCVTVEDISCRTTDRETLSTVGHFYKLCFEVLQQIRAHLRSNSLINLTHGRFFFMHDKDRDKLILLFAMELKAEKPLEGLIQT